ncbi:MAG: ribosome biogenesis GTPase Der, partial [Candidatus Omnitrophica bacterium]|nr:ribosome biogenesis GTPase Der [Candidatus Omnitrophota bacterium]
MARNKSLPTVCIVGRPNVGKSSLFNALLNMRKSVVLEESGTTRDRAEALLEINGFAFNLIDTGGYLKDDEDILSPQIKKHILVGIEESVLAIFVVDITEGISPCDIEVAHLLRKANKKVLVVANKSDNNKMDEDITEFYSLGFEEVLPISCLHRRGIYDLCDKIMELTKENLKTVPDEEEVIKIAVVGRPNVGKSSFVNSLLGEERVIVSAIPGTTRDSIDTNFNYNNEKYILVDTAGIRHKRKIKNVVDLFSIMRSTGTIERADMVLLLIDAADGFRKDDQGVLDIIEENYKGCVIGVNKWDLAQDVEDITQEDYKKRLLEELPRLGKFPIIFLSANTGKNIRKTLELIRKHFDIVRTNFSTPQLNKILKKFDPGNISIPKRCKKPNFLYMTQISANPIEFFVFVNEPKNVLPL